MRLGTLSVSAFRSIASEVKINFTSPLTLVFAANGTGKTTLCDAVEWLLTGEIVRLGASRDADFAALRCKFAVPTDAMHVTGSLVTPSGKSLLTRTEKEWLIADEGAEKKRATANQVLRLLSPSSLVTSDAHHTQETKIRRDWIRGLRLFTEHTRSMLVDADEVNIQARERMLSDLLGVGELTARAEKLSKFADHLNSGAQTEKGLAALKKELATRERLWEQLIVELEDKTPDIVAPPHVWAKQELVAAARLCSEELEGAELADLFSETKALIENKRYNLSERRSCLDRLQHYWSEIPALKDSIGKAQVMQAVCADDLDAINDEILEIGQTNLRTLSQISHNKSRVQAFIREQTALFAVAKEVESRLHQAHPEPTLLSLDDLFETVEGWTEERIAQSSIGIVQLKEGLSVARDHLRALAMLKKTLKESEVALPSKAEVERLEWSVLVAHKDLSAKKGQHESVSGPLEALRLATRVFVESVDAGEECPICGHIWKSKEKLRAAISESLEKSPESLLALEQEIVYLEKQAKVAEADLESAKNCRARHTEQNEKLSQIRERLHLQYSLNRRYINELRTMPGFLSLLSRARAGTADVPFPQRIEQEAALMVGICKLRSILHNDAFRLDASKFRDLHLLQIGDALDAEKKVLEAAVWHDQQLLEQNRLWLIKLEAKRTETVAALDAHRATLQQKQPLWLELKESWHKIAGDSDPSDEGLDEVVFAIRTEEEQLSEAEGHLNTAQLVLDADTQRREAENLAKEIKELKEQTDRIGRLRESALKAACLLESKAKSYCYDQTTELFDVAYPMFSRVHSNEMFEAIHPGSQEDPFNWIADSLGHTFSPSTDFSMGQRQDLALSIFLSRARSLGGTFLLDEPVIHLDDLNRIALLDMFRVLVTESGSRCNFVVTTANRSLVRHLEEKFASVSPVNGAAPLSIYELDGSPKFGVKVKSSHAVGLGF
ncbi:AAA family ATPase [Geomonas paludis]|uniref:AAA family ATPase n=1 Tax=Geomonas paludis TaxID=2740185 RepID=A0ABY4L9K1_9BACT|nr:AAA family ATPase [Geomonas paludis]UPU34668.1 AAA family ATPase [Geomonas paludis]